MYSGQKVEVEAASPHFGTPHGERRNACMKMGATAEMGICTDDDVSSMPKAVFVAVTRLFDELLYFYNYSDSSRCEAQSSAVQTD